METGIYHMDCLEGMKTMPAESIDIIITDPPYNTGLSEMSGRGERGQWLNKFFNDAYSEEEYLSLVNEWSSEFFRILKSDRPVYVFINWKSYPIWFNALSAAGFRIKNCIVWDKEIHGLNYQNYAYRHEFLIFAVKGDFSPLNKTKYYTDIWRFKRRTGNMLDEYEHETVKPIEIIREIIKQSSEKDWVVLDPFLGSGTTAVAAKQMNMPYIGFEIEEKYFKTANKRLSQDVLFFEKTTSTILDFKEAENENE